MKTVAKNWAKFVEKRFTTFGFWRFFGVGLVLTVLSLIVYIRREDQLYLVGMVLGLLTVSQSLAGYGFRLRIEELKNKQKEERISTE